jgi:hypothetical protein
MQDRLSDEGQIVPVLESIEPCVLESKCEEAEIERSA